MDNVDFKSEIWSIMYIMKSKVQKLIDPLIQAEGLTMIQVHILFGICCGKITNVGSICREFGLNQGNGSTLCKNMEKDGLIVRDRSKEDERVVKLSITDEGMRRIKNLKDTATKLDADYHLISPERRKKILEGLQELAAVIEEISIN
jgi:Transcriptional regulators